MIMINDKIAIIKIIKLSNNNNSNNPFLNPLYS